MAYPLFVAVLTLLFAWQVASDYAERRRIYQALWCAALLMSAGASLAYVHAVQNGAVWAFKVYYILGALLVAPCMGLGSLYLSFSPRWVSRLGWVVGALGAAGAYFIARAGVNPELFAALAGSSGRGVLMAGPWLPFVITLNLFGTAAVAGVALYAAVAGIRRRIESRFFLGNLTIGAGFAVVGMAGGVARWLPDWDGAFWATMALGWLIAFGGFRLVAAAAAARRHASPVKEPDRSSRPA